MVQQVTNHQAVELMATKPQASFKRADGFAVYVPKWEPEKTGGLSLLLGIVIGPPCPTMCSF